MPCQISSERYADVRLRTGLTAPETAPNAARRDGTILDHLAGMLAITARD